MAQVKIYQHHIWGGSLDYRGIFYALHPYTGSSSEGSSDDGTWYDLPDGFAVETDHAGELRIADATRYYDLHNVYGLPCLHIGDTPGMTFLKKSKNEKP